MINPVALARDGSQSIMIDDGNPTVAVIDQPSPPEPSGNAGNPRSPGTEHRCQELMGHGHNVGLSAIRGHQQPTGATLFDRVQSIARRCLRTEVEERIDEPVDNCAKGRTLLESLFARGAAHSQCGPWDLDDDVLSGDCGAEQGGEANQTLGANHPDLARRAIGHDGHD